jgi:hypothetical protein
MCRGKESSQRQAQEMGCFLLSYSKFNPPIREKREKKEMSHTAVGSLFDHPVKRELTCNAGNVKRVVYLKFTKSSAVLKFQT